MKIDSVVDSLCFKLHLASRVMTGLYKTYLSDVNLTFPQFLLMGLLWEENNQTIKQLGKQLQLDSGTLTPLVKRLEKEGLVLRKRQIEDERSNAISLTPKGQALSTKARKAAEHFYQNLSLQETERGQLKALLDCFLSRQLEKQTTN